MISVGAEIPIRGGFSDVLQVRSWKEARDEGLSKQEFDYSCGAASLTSILAHYYGIKVSEFDVIDRIGLKNAFSMADLAAAATEYGFKAIGLGLDYEMLMRLRRPVIVYLDYWDDGHFSVVRTIDHRGVWLADPAWGNIWMSRERFEGFWRTRKDSEVPGRILVLVPRSDTEVSINEGFLLPPKRNAGMIVLPTLDALK